MKLGFIGLGNMGGPMCRNLIKGVNHEVVVYDLNPEAIAACTAVGGTAGSGIESLAADCDVIFTSLPTPKHVEAVAAIIGAHAKSGTALIDLSTNAPTVVRRLAEEMAAKGIGFLDSPVTGGVIRATDGTIVIMVGGEAATVEANRGLLASFSSQVVHVGPVGSGSVAKLINNMLGLCNMAIAAEGLMLGALAGIDMGILAGIIQNGSGDSAAFRGMANRALKGNFNASFALDLAYKDVGLAVDLAAEHGLPGLMAPEALNLMRMGRAMGLGGQDSTSVLQVYEKIMGKEARS